ncbi:uncharacterized protein Bfra_009286 [Botrytis fragariae]|uniref:Uncharacterized protein n=1 Tax=Botrytis fragariae TaxID=1964551 RepID=A0A8H6EG71_9HELO|nr:uncharacterized protein Bfra_009286 [Botrytis fragariae]KAF5870735.1 hypothetical protein Bfra_009286 [Botrytis fragariae]
MFHTCELQIRGMNMTRKLKRMQRLYTCSAVSPGIKMESLARHHELTQCRYHSNKHYGSKSKFDWAHRNSGH